MILSAVLLVLIVGYCAFLIRRGYKRKKENKGFMGCSCGSCSGCSGLSCGQKQTGTRKER